MRVANIFDLKPWRRKIEVLIDVEFVHQSIIVDLDTVLRILFDIRWKIDRELFCRDCEPNEVENLRIDSEPEVE